MCLSFWLFIQAGLLPHLIAFSHIRMYFEESVVEYQPAQLSWAPWLFEAVPHGNSQVDPWASQI